MTLKKFCIILCFLFLTTAFTFAIDDNSPSTDYVYNLLELGEKILYSRIESAILRNQPSLPLVYETTETNLKVLNAYLDDHPGIFWIDHSISLSVQKKGSVTVGTEIQFEYTHKDNLEAERKEIYETCNMFHENIKNMDDYMKLYAIYTFICKYAKYNVDYFDQSIYSVIHEGIGVCAGIARTFQYLALQEGINCILCKGYTKNMDGTVNNVPHLWCMVNLNGTWYHVDPTSGLENSNGFVNYAFFMRDTQTIQRTHIIYSDYKIPYAPDDSLSYSRVKGNFLDSYSLDRVTYVLKNELSGDNKVAIIEFETLEDLKQAVKELFDEGKIFMTLMMANKTYKQVTYYSLDDIRTLRIELIQ